MSLDLMAERTSAFFARCFGHPPRWVVAAPGRVNLIGEHTDYNEGFVLPMAIGRQTLLLGEPTQDSEVTLHSVTTGETAIFDVDGGVQRGEPAWSNYVRGVIAGFQRHGAIEVGARCRRRHGQFFGRHGASEDVAALCGQPQRIGLQHGTDEVRIGSRLQHQTKR